MTGVEKTRVDAPNVATICRQPAETGYSEIDQLLSTPAEKPCFPLSYPTCRNRTDPYPVHRITRCLLQSMQDTTRRCCCRINGAVNSMDTLKGILTPNRVRPCCRNFQQHHPKSGRKINLEAVRRGVWMVLSVQYTYTF